MVDSGGMDANTVGAVADLTGVSVRTLHHYDHIGLAVPSIRTPAGYRGYTDADIERLHLVLVYRSVGMPLDEIRALLDDSSADVLEHLRRQHTLLRERAERLQHTIKAVEDLMNAYRQGIQLTAQEQVEIFGTEALAIFSSEYAAEAEQRWGQTDALKQSQQRVSQFSKQDWIAIKAEGDALLEALAQAKRRGVEPGSDEANELAARHRASIERFYDCGDEMHRNLVEMYLADERFTRYYDAVESGLAQFMHHIVVARCLK
jgi:DNA-binding transcriptional MerR regulator